MKQFLKKIRNIIFTKADKGNITVVLEKNSYTEKINVMLMDEKAHLKRS